MERTVTDIHIKKSDPESSIIYPGPRRPLLDEMNLIRKLLAAAEQIDRDDFMLQEGAQYWRGRRDKHAVDGTWYRLRCMAEHTPTLDTLPSPIPEPVKSILLSSACNRGGLIHIAGKPGTGKTTTASALVVSRLLKHGGVAYTIEDPPEMPLNGWHGNGYCSQTWVAGEGTADWMESMRGALRSQPVGTNLIMFIGEVRDPDTAKAILRAAANGFLVITTGFGTDLISAIDTLFQLISRDYAASLAAVLYAVLYLQLDKGRIGVQVLRSDGPASTVGTIIRSGVLASLQNEIMYQRNQLIKAMAA